MNDNTLFTINAKLPEQPILQLKNIRDTLTDKHPEKPDAGYLTLFINFVESQIQKGEIRYLLMKNSGPSTEAAGHLLLTIGTSQSLDRELVPELYENVYELSRVKKPGLDQVHFMYTSIPGLWEWWEKGVTKEESFGTVEENTLIGFVRVGLQ